jgi:signal peptidase I
MSAWPKAVRFGVQLTVYATLGALLSVAVREYVVQMYRIESSSMAPTLHAGDQVLVEKLSYLGRTPQYGDIVVVRAEQDSTSALRRILRGPEATPTIKRVAGVGGDQVAVVGGRLVRNGVVAHEPWALLAPDDPFAPVVVAEGTLFLLGDNRAFSADSRTELGLVQVGRVVGRARWRLHPQAGRLPDARDTVSPQPLTSTVLP